ncbi:MAG TPA: helix-turn-helix domain-containing protein [Candidatus Synoicihabitans sp.]|nr:helix-turn-helix domain-containing protein [Candidatus Synoicihabitans sp.]
MQNIGERLEEARKRKGISIREAAEATKVRGDYLHKFESNQFDINLPDIYIRGFLRTYANYLKLPADKIVADYNGLGLGDGKSRPLNREIYGRMELSVASAKDAAREPEPAAPSAPPAEVPAESKPSRERANPATFIPRARNLYIDKALLIKGGAVVVGVALLVLLLVWGITALTGRSGGGAAVPTAPASDEKRIVLIALDTVAVTLVQELDNTKLFEGTLVRGESRIFPKRGNLFLTASALENIEVEMNGNRHAMRLADGTQMRGRGRVKIE